MPILTGGAVVNRCLLALVLMVAVSAARSAFAEGEAIEGFPNWAERVLLEWNNRARSDPQADLAACSPSACADKACYAPIAPRHANVNLLHSARFHAAHQSINGYSDYPTHCTLDANIGTTYPQSCSGAASCSCSGGALTADPSSWTQVFTRIAIFGGSGGGEVNSIGLTDPDSAFYATFYSPDASSTCPSLTSRNAMLAPDTLAGAGAYLSGGASHMVMDFGNGAAGTGKIPSGSHFPQQAAAVDAWANWYDSAGPSLAKINVGGVYSNMTLDRGTQTNGAWHASVSGVGSGCHRYVFAFKDSGGADVFYPTHGSLAIGDGSVQCPDFSYVEPPIGTGFDRIFEYNFEP